MAAPWYGRWQQQSKERRTSPRRAGRGAPRSSSSVVDNSESYDYLLDSLRINAPGYADQNTFEMSRQYTGINYLAINTLCTQASQAEVSLYEQDTDDPDSRLPLSRYEEASRLFQEPNPDDTFGELVEQITLQYSLTGTGLVWLPHDHTNPDAVPEEAYCLSTASVLPQPLSPRYPNGAYLVQPWYPAGPYAQIPMAQGVGSIVPAEQILRIKKPHPFFRWIGYATLFAISTQMDAARQIDISRMNAFFKGLDPNFVLSFDPQTKQPNDADLRRLEAQMQAVYAGPVNAGRTFIAPAGATLTKVSNTPAEMAYQEGWQQLLDFGLATFGVNRAVAGMTGELNFATFFASLQSFYFLTLNPLLNKIACKFNQHLLHRFFDRSFFLELTGKSITDKTVLEAEINTDLKAGIRTVGEIRKLRKLRPSPWDAERAWDKRQPGLAGPEETRETGPSRDGRQDPSVEASRPENTQGAGSMGPRKSMVQHQDNIMGAMERHLTRGTILPAKE